MAFVSPVKSWPRKVRSKADRIGIRWSYATTMIATVVAVVLIGLVQIQFLPGLNNLIFDLYQRLDRRTWDPQSPVRISISTTSRFPGWASGRGRAPCLPMPSTGSEISARGDCDRHCLSERDGSLERALALLPPSEGRAH
jgi:hypothetical protein